MKATYLWHGGSDLTVVNAARVSFGKAKSVFDDKDARLLRYLASHKHELPFAHPHVAFHFKAPIFVARQLAKHQVGFVWSEISRRYVTSEPEFWWPTKLRRGSADIKQGSTDEEWENPTYVHLRNPNVDGCFIGKGGNLRWSEHVHAFLQDAVALYEAAVADGLAAEQARMILPQNVYTEWHWTGSLLGWSRIWGLRVKPDAQRETKELVEQIDAPLSQHFPVAWKVLKEVHNGNE